MKLLALITDTFREIYAKKIIIGIVVIEVIALLITAYALNTDTIQEEYRAASVPLPTLDREEAPARRPGLPNDTSLLGSDGPTALDSTLGDTITRSRSDSAFENPAGPGIAGGPPGELRPVLTEMIAGQLGAFSAVIALATLFIGIFTTAGIVPSMMEKGTIDLLISKPIPRVTLLFGRALGGFIAIAINLIVFVVALWALYGSASGVWHMPFLIWGTIVPLFTFLVLFSAIIVLNVFTESWVLPMSLAYIHLMILANFLSSREALLFNVISNKAVQGIITGLYYILPQTGDLIGAAPQGVLTGSIGNTGPFIQGTIFAAAMLSLAAWKFQRKDF